MTLPQAFIDEINNYGAECLSGLANALTETVPTVSVRVNRAKGVAIPDETDLVAWCKDGFYLDERPAFTFDPAMHQGLYYVQDASSMAISHVGKLISKAENRRPLVCLDACAAPGGKTTALLSSLPYGSSIIANEYDHSRAAVLAENIAKWGSPYIMVSRGDTARFSNLNAAFDIITADVPCSGEGMMRKDSDAVGQWSASLVKECVERQREIVSNLWPALRPGGYMIYSTCTFNRHENEEMVEYICQELGGKTVDTGLTEFEGVAPGINTDLDCYRFIPGRIKGEGLFMALIRKNGDAPRQLPKAARKPISSFTKAPKEALPMADKLEGDYKAVMNGDIVYAIPTDITAFMLNAASWLDVISIGTATATVKGRDYIPTQALALSSALRHEALPRVQLSYNEALTYLRRETINIDAPRGFVLVCYNDFPLGFVKNLGNRANNLYPSAWRIISRNTPDTPPQILNQP